MSAIQLEAPDDGSPRSARDVLILAAVELFELGKFSSGRAAQLAGVERVELLLALRQYQVSPFQTTAEELRQDISNA